MRAERHYDEETLIAMMHSHRDALSRDEHLASCATCTQTLESFSTIADVLADDTVWDLKDAEDAAAAARGAASLRSYVTAMHDQDAAAAALVGELLASPRRWWVAAVQRDTRYQNAAVARRLIEVADQRVETTPAEAVDVAAAAVAVAEALPPGEEAFQLRGAACRQHGFALFSTGDFPLALAAIDAGQKALEQCVVSDHGLARLDIARSLIYTAQERYDDALVLVRRAATVFQGYGDSQRYVSARLGEVYALNAVHRFHESLDILTQLSTVEPVDAYTRAAIASNIASTEHALGCITDAVRDYERAAVLFEQAGVATEAIRLRHNVARLLVLQGNQREAKTRFSEAKREYERLGMIHLAVICGLDLAEIALIEGDSNEVERLCRAAMAQFDAARLTYGQHALTALAFLREAAEQRRATQETVWHVKTYIRRLPQEPALLFAPAPLPPI